jgi:hypothetical protein
MTALVPGLYLHERSSFPDRPDMVGLKTGLNPPSEAYLLHNQRVGVTCNFGRLPEVIWDRWRNGQGLTMWLVIYVDYIDAFDERRRRGVAYFVERFDQDKFEYEPKPGYNYDRKREKGEGRDWNEPAE